MKTKNPLFLQHQFARLERLVRFKNEFVARVLSEIREEITDFQSVFITEL
jgi:hypothetical protein